MQMQSTPRYKRIFIVKEKGVKHFNLIILKEIGNKQTSAVQVNKPDTQINLVSVEKLL